MEDSVGFRFHPTQQEIISYFLERKMCCPAWPSRTVHEVKNICKYDPWDLPEHSPLPPDDHVWYFFNVPVSKSPNSKGTERTTNIGFWKVTGKDRPIRDKQGKKEIGFKKYLVFYTGRAPNGVKTNWVMHEYHSNNVSSDKEKYVLFRLKRKSGDSSDTCNEPSRHLASDSRNYAEHTASQVNLLDNNRLDRNSLPQLPSSIQLGSCSNRADRIHLPALFSSQPDRRTSSSSGSDRNPLSALFSSIQPDRRTSYSNGADGNSLSALFSSFQSDRRNSSSTGSDCSLLPALFSSIQSGQGTSYSNGLDRNSLPTLFSSIQPDRRTSYSNGADGNSLSALFSSIQSDRRTSSSSGSDCNPLPSLFSPIQSGQGTSYSNGLDRNNSLPALFSSNQLDRRTSYSNEADDYLLSAMFSSVQSAQGESNSLSPLFSSIQSEQRTSYTDGSESNPLSALFSSIRPERGTSFSNGSDGNSLSALFSTIQPEHRTPNDEWNLSDSHFNTSEQEDAFLYEDFVYTESGPALENPILFNINAIAQGYSQMATVGASNETSSSSVGGQYRGDNGSYQEVYLQFELQSGNSDTEMDYLDELQIAEFPPSPRTCRAQYTPISHHVIQDKCATKRVQSQGKGSCKTVPKDEATEAARHVIDPPRKEKNVEKFDKDQKKAQTTNAKTSSKFRSDESDGSNRKSCLFILQETPPFGHKTTPPLVYIGNILVIFVVIIFFIWEMASLH